MQWDFNCQLGKAQTSGETSCLKHKIIILDALSQTEHQRLKKENYSPADITIKIQHGSLRVCLCVCAHRCQHIFVTHKNMCNLSTNFVSFVHCKQPIVQQENYHKAVIGKKTKFGFPFNKSMECLAIIQQFIF